MPILPHGCPARFFAVTLRICPAAGSLSLRFRQKPVPLRGPWAFALTPLQALLRGYPTRFYYGSFSITVILSAVNPVSFLTISIILVTSFSLRPFSVEDTTTLALLSLIKHTQSP